MCSSDLITFADHKVALARTVVQVIDIQSLRVAFPDKVNGYDGILGAKIRRRNVKRDILHKNIASEYDILQEMAFQNAIFYIITLQF